MLKPSQASRHQPLLHLVGDHRGRAEQRRAGIAAETLGKLPHGEVLALCQPMARSRPLLLALVSGISGNGPSGIEPRRVGAERDRQRGDGAVVVHQAVQLRPLLARLVQRIADHDEGAGQDLQMVGVAAQLRHAALDVGVEARARR